jgi:hypothetical protein
MAATGLLGINPYFKGVQIDTSKPVNLAIQLEQKNQAKREALDKYFMDYEKSINPAGMRSQDQDIVLKKLNENKQYYMQNRDKILNPSRYGAEAQSQYMAGFKDILSDISKSKQASAEDKVAMNFYQKAKTSNLDIPDGFMDAIQTSQKPIYAGYKPVDLFQFDFNKKYDESEFTKNVWGGLTLPTKEVPTKLPNGQIQYTKTSYLTPDIAQTVALNAINEYKNKPGSTKNFNNLMKDANIFSAAEREFGEAFKYTDPQTKKVVKPRIESPEQFVAGYALLKKPRGEMSKGKADFDWLTKFRMQQGAIDRRADKKEEEMGDPVESFITDARSGKTYAGVEGENIEVMNLPDYILKDLGKDKKPARIGRGIGDGKFYNIVYQKEIDKKTGKETGNYTDLIDWGKTEPIPESQIRASIVSRALPSKAKVNLVGGTGSKAGSKPNLVKVRKFN